VRLYEMGMCYRRQIIRHYENGFTTRGALLLRWASG